MLVGLDATSGRPSTTNSLGNAVTRRSWKFYIGYRGRIECDSSKAATTLSVRGPSEVSEEGSKKVHISQDELDNQKVYDVYSSAFMDPSIDADGDVYVRVDSVRIYVKADQKRNALQMFSIFGLEEAATRTQALELANRFNDRLIMVRCTVNEGPSNLVLYMDFWMPSYDGITAETLVRLTRRFASIAGEVIEHDFDKIIS